MSKNRIWVLIPAFNASRWLKDVVESCRLHCSNVLVVDDGSTDDTLNVARRSGALTVGHKRNSGKGAAIKTGFRWLQDRDCAASITLDADGQHDPQEIPAFLRCYERLLEDGCKDFIVIGARIHGREKMPLYRAIPNRVGEFFISLAARRHITDTQSGYRLYTKGVMQGIRCTAKGFDMEAEMLIKAARSGARIEEIPIEAIYGDAYHTNFRPVADFYRISITVLRNIL